MNRSVGLRPVQPPIPPPSWPPPPQNEAPSILGNAACWSLHMGLSSNLRYQVLGGADTVRALQGGAGVGCVLGMHVSALVFLWRVRGLWHVCALGLRYGFTTHLRPTCPTPNNHAHTFYARPCMPPSFRKVLVKLMPQAVFRVYSAIIRGVNNALGGVR